MELKYLSHVTGDPKYATRAQHVIDTLEEMGDEYLARFGLASGGDGSGAAPFAKMGLLTTLIDRRTGGPMNGGLLTVGALSDSYYEYLLKQYLLTNMVEPRFRHLCASALSLQ